MRLLFITQKVDRADWLLGFAHGWVKSLAARVEQLTVICLAKGEVDLPSNVKVISLGKERGASRAGRAINFAKAMAATIGEADGVFTHMSPPFAIAAAPFTKLRRIPLVMWHTHRAVTLQLKLAVALSDVVVTASRESLQLATPKARVLGHGINPAQFSPLPLAGEEPPLILAVGRLSSIKRYELLIEAVKRLRARGLEFRCAIVGVAPPGAESYKQKLRTLAASDVEFVGAVPHAQIAEWYFRSAVAVNLSAKTGMDKTTLEAMFCGRPVLAADPTFASLLGAEGADWQAVDDPEVLADKLAMILADPVGSAERAIAVRARAVAAHSLERLMDQLIQVFKERIDSYV
ncbi:MAG: glycosyltransferase family 4 protein [Chloroflexi bacterium]|nr:glycosyltransferase family 4 protein [Chloroflexota bacterium]